ncbi:hypothetical protein FD09_GL002640 [Schleiferilactobacillus perolens DSM 12744]|uniref:Uncharacterized protein n=1 Tax=Schleiferilactobacillus perolens DSM 12744 TaxID=1423792 RepID=A0A0R1N9M8_9LACO|nr:hypothetical protein FD09_GL002640 [Schleiferilactobacillus perolens DSM 12744]
MGNVHANGVKNHPATKTVFSVSEFFQQMNSLCGTDLSFVSVCAFINIKTSVRNGGTIVNMADEL